jgi:hypothetical protein
MMRSISRITRAAVVSQFSENAQNLRTQALSGLRASLQSFAQNKS